LHDSITTNLRESERSPSVYAHLALLRETLRMKTKKKTFPPAVEKYRYAGAEVEEGCGVAARHCLWENFDAVGNSQFIPFPLKK